MHGKKLTKMVDRVEALEKTLENFAMVQQVTNAVIKRLLSDSERYDKELTTSLNMLNEIQYRTLAMIDVAGLSNDKLNESAEALRVKDFEDMSKKDDEDNSLIDSDVVTDESVVTITSTAVDASKSIFRSKFFVEGIKGNELHEKVMGAKLGDEIKVNIDGVEHTVKILAVKKPAPQVAVVTDESAVATPAEAKPE
jgi:hypothetical protein